MYGIRGQNKEIMKVTEHDGVISSRIGLDANISNRKRKKILYGISGRNSKIMKADFMEHLPQVNSGIGFRMLRGMGWQHGDALGKRKVGHTVPVTVSAKFNRTGLCTKDEKEALFGSELDQSLSVKKMTPIQTINGKHPVTLLSEQCVKHEHEPPKFETVFDNGHTNFKSVLVRVIVSGRIFQPSKPSPYNKHAKASAAFLALQQLGWTKEEGTGKEKTRKEETGKEDTRLEDIVNEEMGIEETGKEDDTAGEEERAEISKTMPPTKTTVPNLVVTPIPMINGKHPVSLLAEICTKKHLPPPKYDTQSDLPNQVVVTVFVSGRIFVPPGWSPFKKHGKAMAATHALKTLQWGEEEKQVVTPDVKANLLVGMIRKNFVGGGFL